MKTLKAFIICLATILFFSFLAVASTELNEDKRQFNLLYKDIDESYEKHNDDYRNNRLLTLWNRMDDIVLSYLNSPTDKKSSEQLFSGFAGYKPFFYHEGDEDPPTYLLKSLTLKEEKYFIGVYRYNPYFPGRLSLYRKVAGAWIRSTTFDSKVPVLLYYFPDALSKGFLITLERFSGADRDESDLKSWIVEDGRLIAQPFHYEALVDSDIKTATSSLSISYTRFLDHMCESVAGTRADFKVVFTLTPDGKLHGDTYSLTPWLVTLNSYFGVISQNNTEAAKQFTKDKKILNKLRRNYCASISKHGGNLNKGTAFADITAGLIGYKNYRVKFTKQNGEWLILNVQEIKKN